MDLTIIAAVSDNNVIGYNGRIPWRIPEDMKRFKALTMEHPIVMGRKSYESIPEKFRPLPGRKNIVLTRKDFNPQGVYVAHSLEEALTFCEDKDSYVAGGEDIYRQFLPLTSKMEITRVHKTVEGDTFLPNVDWNKWEEIFNEPHEGYSFLTYTRKKI